MDIVDLEEVDDLDEFDLGPSTASVAPHKPRPVSVTDWDGNKEAQDKSELSNNEVVEKFSLDAEDVRPFTPDDSPRPGPLDEAPPTRLVDKPQVVDKPKDVDKASELLNRINQRAREGNAATGGKQAKEGEQAERPGFDAQGTAPPILSESKFRFFLGRWLQTVAGGPKLTGNGGYVRLSLAAGQAAIWLLPAAIGIAMSILSEKMSMWVAALTAGGAQLAINLLLAGVRERRSNRVASSSPARSNVLADEDEVDFGLCSSRGFLFIFPPRGARSVAYALVSSCALMFLVIFMQPTRVKLALATSSDASLAVYSFFAWLSISLALYSLNAYTPPELNRYSSEAEDGLLGPLSRTFHIFCLAAPALSSSSLDVLPLRILFLLLPLLWTFGSLPGMSVGLEWAVEQAIMHLGGASPFSSSVRLWFGLILTCGNVCISVVLHLSSGLNSSLAAAAGIGFLLSHDLLLFPSNLLASCSGGQRIERSTAALGNLAVLGKLLGRVLALVVLVGVPLLLEWRWKQSVGADLLQHREILLSLDLVLSVLLLVTWTTSSLQTPFLLSIFSNPFKGLRVQQDAKLSRGRSVLAMMHRGSMRCGEWIMFVCVLLHVEANISSSSPTLSFSLLFQQIALTRILRKIWQNPSSSLLELFVAVWYIRGRGCEGVQETFCSVPEVALCAGWILSRCSDCLSKLSFAVVLAVTSWIDVKQRSAHARQILQLLVLGLPFAAVILLASSALAAPLLPVLGVPIFLIGFPRPRRHWPLSASFSSSSFDAAYYKQLVPSLSSSLLRALRQGSLGFGWGGDELLLVRREGMILFVQLLEQGRDYVHFVFKGLEFQETSCHHVEAGAVEEAMNEALQQDSSSSPSSSSSTLRLVINKRLMTAMVPLCVLPVELYSIGDIQLTGIIDRPENSSALPQLFSSALTWLLHQRLTQGLPSSWFDFRELENLLGMPLDQCEFASFDEEWARFVGMVGGGEGQGAREGGTEREREERRQTQGQQAEAENSQTFNEFEVSHPSTLLKDSGSIKSKAALPMLDLDEEEDLDDFIDKLTVSGTNFGEPQSDKDLEGTDCQSNVTCCGANFGGSEDETAAPTLLTYDNTERSKLLLALRRLHAACWGVVEEWGHTNSSSGPDHVVSIFQEQLPSCLHARWLEERPELKKLVLQAYKYAFKFVYDISVYGLEQSHEELRNTFSSLDSDWQLGSESSADWAEAVAKRTPNLMAVFKEEGTFRARVATLMKSEMQVARLNGESVRGLWSALNMELLYFANDDDERYSIQANTRLLRNMVIQAAPPPLGYPLYMTCRAEYAHGM